MNALITAATDEMAEARSNVAVLADQSATIASMQRRIDALIIALAVIENDLRLSRCVAEHVSTLNVCMQGRDDDRMRWSA